MSVLQAIYRFFWSRTTKRPWTYQIRDWTLHHPLRVWPAVTAIAAAFVVGQVELTRRFGRRAAPFVLFADFMAFVAGHLWWDTAGAYVKEVDDFGS